MSDPLVDIIREQQALARRIGQTEVRETPYGFGVGTSFPTSPSTDDRFFRTDLGWLCYYDGTRWLTVHEYEADLTPYGRSAQPYAGAATTLLLVPARTDRSYYITRAKAYLDVNATNNGANYWSLRLKTNGGTAIWDFNTSADAAGAALNKESSVINTVYAGVANFAMDVSGKTGAPGSLVINASFWYRLVVT